MTTAYTSLLGLALPVTGELSGTWGDTVNNAITSLLDSAVAGTTTVSTDADVTLTTTTGAANQAREAILLFSGARTALRNVTAPAQSKIYTVINATTGGYSVVLRGAGPTTGLTIPAGASAVVAWNGSDFIEIGTSSIGNLTVNGNLTVTGTSTLTGAITNTAGTANGVAYLNGSKVLTTGSALTFDGTNLSSTGGATFLGGPSGYGGGEVRLGATTADTQSAVSTQATGSPVLSFDHRGTSNTGLFRWRNGSGAGTTLMELAASGNLGLGVTPSAWTNGLKAIEVGNLGSSVYSGGQADMNMTSNAYFNSGWKYGGTGGASKISLSGNTFAFSIAPSGTAGNAITFTQAMTLDASGNLGVGTTSPVALNSGGGYATFNNASGGGSVYQYGAANIGYIIGNTDGLRLDTFTGKILKFGIEGTERARIDSSGNLLVGTTTIPTAGQGGTSIGLSTGNGLLRISATSTGTTGLVNFNNPNGNVGYIATTGSVTAYVTTSDQRLKENILDAESASALIDSIKVRQYDWKSDSTHQRYGFIAQELVTVAPEAVHQPVNKEDMMGVDYSKLVPMLVKEIQSLRKRLATLESK